MLNPPIPHARLESLLNILRKDLIPNLPKSAKTFLLTNKVNYRIENLSQTEDDGFIYFGITKHLQKCINPVLHNTNRIELLINVDGLPLFKSSSKQIWPILCKVFNDLDVYHPFVTAIYCGDGKPSNINI